MGMILILLCGYDTFETRFDLNEVYMTEIKVSSAILKDATEIGKIAFQTAQIHYKALQNEFQNPTEETQIDYIKKSILDKNILVLKAEVDSKILGYTVVYFNTYLEQYFKFSKRGFIGSIGVDQNHRGKGIGQALLNGVETELKKRGISVVEIDVYTFNHDAEKLYESFGYEDIKHYKRKFIE